MPDSSIGFGSADWLEFVLATLFLLSAFLWTPALRRRVAALAQRTIPVMALLFLTPILLRLLLLPNHPVPVANVYDEFSHLLVASTLLHGRFANPPHALSQFFETFFVLQHPTYSSIYPPGQGMILALGLAVSGTPWTGVLLASGALCACSFWMLRGYVEPTWALLGGLLAIARFGPLNLWMNCYWGGALPAAAGCFVFGSLPRLHYAWSRGLPPRKRDAALLGIGFGFHLLTRPFESVLLAMSVLLLAAIVLQRSMFSKPVLNGALWSFFAVSPALILLALQNKQVTGSWTTLPEQLSQFQYGVPTTLTVELPAVPHIDLTPQQALDFRAQTLMHGPGTDSLKRFFLRLEYRIRDYRFFFQPPLYLAAVAFLFALRSKVYLWIAATLAIFACGTNLFPYLLVHYLAAVTSLFLLVSIAGLQQLARLRVRDAAVGPDIVRVLVLLSLAPFLLWYGIHLFEGHGAPLALLQYETWDFIPHRNVNSNADRRTTVANRIANLRGKLLVFVHYAPQHPFQEEWVWNAADIDKARVVFARDLGAAENEELLRFYPDRKAFWLEPDHPLPLLEPLATAPK